MTETDSTSPTVLAGWDNQTIQIDRANLTTKKGSGEPDNPNGLHDTGEPDDLDGPSRSNDSNR